MKISLDYEELAEAIGRVLTTGPERLARLAAIPDPWEALTLGRGGRHTSLDRLR